MRRRFLSLLLLTSFAGFSQAKFPNVGFLPRALPEKEGVQSKGIIDFLDAAGKSSNEFHSFMFLRHGKVIAEGWWYPYRPDLKHSMYSVTKSFVSTAVGLAIGEGRFKLTDKVISFFPKELPDTISSYLAQLTIKDLLTMSMGHDPDPTPRVTSTDNWIKASLAVPIVHEPGTKFLYNNIGPNLLSAIIQRLTGQKMIDYLRPRLFEPLGIRGVDWEVGPQGINTGGWGLRVKTEDMAKLGQLYLQKGLWKGHRLLPEQWVEEATGSRILQDPGLSQAKRDSSDWQQGYGYLFWQCRNHAYRGDGAFGQFIIVMPDKDAVIILTSETPDMQAEIDLAWKYLLPAIQKDELPANEKMVAILKQRVSSLALPLPVNGLGSPLEKDISGKTFVLQPNDMQLQQVSFRFTNGECSVLLKKGTAEYALGFGSGKWKLGETTMHGPYLVSHAKANLTGLPPFKLAGAYRWEDENTLELTLRYIESPHTQKFICRFDKNNILIDVRNSLFPTAMSVLKGGTR